MSISPASKFWLPLACGLALLAGCASKPSTGGSGVKVSAQGREVTVGDEMHQQIIAEGAAYDDVELQAYVDRVGQGLVSNSDKPNYTFTFTVLDSPDINAFATPGGYIYLNRGLLAYLDSEAELAGVLSHEIGHITGRHHGRRQTADITNKVLATTVYILTGSGDIADAASKPKPKPKGTKVVSQWLMADTGGFKPGRKITKREGARVIMKAKLAGLDRHRSKRVEKGGGGSMESVFKANSHCVATFSLQLLWSQMKLSQAKKGRKALENTPKITLDRRVLSPHNKTHREMLDPFVGLCVSWAKKGASDDVVLLALQCVGAMLVWGSHHPGGTLEALPSMKVHIDKFVANLFGLLEMCAVSSSTSNIKIQAIFRLMTLILRECPYCKLNKAQLSVLVSFVRQDMTEIEHQQATFALLKAIVFRGFVSVEVYDLMQKVLELMIQSHRHTVRTLCSQVFVAFLMSYPLTNTKRETHLRKLLQCLDYDYAEGRLAALECVHGLLLKLPAPVIEENTQMLFLALVLRLVNDEDQKCRLSTSVVLKVLTRRTSTAECQKCVGVVLQWNGDDGKNQNLILRKAAAQVIGLVIESRKDVFRYGYNGPPGWGRIAGALEVVFSAVSSTIL